MPARLIIGDVFDGIASLPDNSVDLVVTSPPFLALRSYLPADHPKKGKEIGSEPTPGEFIDTLLDVTEALDRVLALHGSLVVELGDTYSGSGGAGGDYGLGGLRDGQAKFNGSALADRKNKVLRGDGQRLQQGPGWPLAKSICLIPEIYRFALAYGFNPLTGRTTSTWRVRNVVRWHRPNPPVGALGDKFRPSTSDLVIACKSRTRYFDLDAVRTEHSEPIRTNIARTKPARGAGSLDLHDGDCVGSSGNPAGAPPLDTWIIPTAPYKGSHYATFPPDLVVKPIKAMCPERVCRTCGEPSRRVVESARIINGAVADDTTPIYQPGRPSNGGGDYASTGGASYGTRVTTPGWTDCGHDDWRTGMVLDPFAGSGTTLSVAVGLGRDSIGIDLDERNADLCQQRVGMFLTVETLAVPI